MKFQHGRARGGFGLGIVVGLLVGLAMALAVALYITRAPIPFVNKVPPRTAAQDTAETERNRNWDPNAPLGSKVPLRPVPGLAEAGAASAPLGASAPVLAGAPVAVPTPPIVATQPPARDPGAILAGSAPTRPAGDPFIYFVQAGAFTRTEDAEAQRARLAIAGHTSKVSEREQAGRTVYRVRLGPLPSREAADGLQSRLKETGMDAQIVRVEKP
jgi:cell division protein FtsN